MGWRLSFLVWVKQQGLLGKVGGSAADKRLPERIRSHMWVEKNTPCMGPYLKRKLVTIFGMGIEREISKG